MKIEIRKAERKQRKFKAALVGVSGSGKTYTALELAKGLAGEGGKVLLLDTENSSSELYADRFSFDVANLAETTVANYIAALKEGERLGYDVVVIDSLSHAWEYLLEEVDNEAKRNRGGNSFAAWKAVTPIYRELVDAIVRAGVHVIATMRAKSDYVMEEFTDGSGKTRTRPVKVGLAPQFRAGGEYEFDVVANLDLDHNLIIEKTRIDWLGGKVIRNADSKLGAEIGSWLSSAKAASAPVISPTAAKSDGVDDTLTREAIKEGFAVFYTLPADWTGDKCATTFKALRATYGVVRVEGRTLACHSEVPELEALKRAGTEASATPA
jgi:hypothetical protein